jgi:hypothetical protein
MVIRNFLLLPLLLTTLSVRTFHCLFYWSSGHSNFFHHFIPISHPDTWVKHSTYGHKVATLLNPRGVTTVLHKYSLTVSRHAAVLMAVTSTVHYPANYKINILFKMKFKNVNKLITLIIYYKLHKVPSYETQSDYNSPFCKRKHLLRVW